MLNKFLSSRILQNSSKLFKLTFRSYRKLGFDRYDYPDNRTRTGLEVSPYKPQFVLTEEEKLGISILK